MTELVITRGYPASGKTTYAKTQASIPGWARVSRDDLRATLFGREGILEDELEAHITAMEVMQVETLLRRGVNAVVDATHLRLRNARKWADIARKLGTDFRVQDFNDVDVDECIRRDVSRARTVGESRIRELAEKFPYSRWEPVVPHPAATAEVQLYVPDSSLPSAFLVDMDGTLASMDGKRGPFEWEKVGEDAPIWPVLELVQHLADRHKIVVMSGRDECCRTQTAEWLLRYNVQHEELLMRPAGDYRKDAIVKAELFDKHVRHRYHVRGVIDDRLQVCRMWHAMGLSLFRVGDPDADF